MARAHEGLADTGFPVPDSIETGGRMPEVPECFQPLVSVKADPRGSAVYTEYFAKGTVPTQVCDHHVAITVCGESGGLPTEFCPLESRHSRTVLVMPERRIRRHRRLPVCNARTVCGPYPVCCGTALGKRDRTPPTVKLFPESSALPPLSPAHRWMISISLWDLPDTC